MAKKKETILDFDNDPEVVEEEENTPIENNNDNENNSASKSNNTIKNASNSDSILSSVLSKTTKKPKKIYTGFYLDEPVKKTIDKVVKQNKDTNKSELVNDLLTAAFKQAGLME
ncbi:MULTISPECIES: hypothetical protein [Bacillus cereus group]|uniref:Uncharacterized protein n=1 Tax=Bacillus thuringiensis TaxID=1428 RepID=A0A9W3VHB3_BACTU|nr:hypothetical protein [Bacillus thuringiensis]AMR06477.1 hypothetical protein AXW78_29685 [Bacillus thuringiensis]AYF85210.1 hypothetical protein D7J84_29845 [Bacillus thuringiensis]PNK35026.1 hypothetical protein CBR55_27300 [Bacillus thuringiensis]